MYYSQPAKYGRLNRALENIKDINKRWCAKHPLALWGINPKTGKHYFKCSTGFKLNQECEIGK